MPQKPEKFDPENNAIHKGLSEPPYNITTQEQFNKHVYRQDLSKDPRKRPVDTREEFGPPEAEVPLDDPFDGDPNALPIETSATGKTGPILPGRGKGAAKPKKSNVQDLKKTLDDTELDPGTKETFDAVESMTPEQLARAQDASANARRPLDEYDDVQPLDDRADMSGERSRMTLDEDERQQIADKLMYDHEVDPQDIYDMSDDQLVATLEDLENPTKTVIDDAPDATPASTKKTTSKKATGKKTKPKESLADDNLEASDPTKQDLDSAEPLDDAANTQKKTTKKSEEKKADDAGDATMLPDESATAKEAGSTPDQPPARRQPKADGSQSGKRNKILNKRNLAIGAGGAVGIFALQQALGPRGAGSITGGGPEGMRRNEDNVSSSKDSGVLPGETMSKDEELDAVSALNKIRDARRAAAGGGDRRLQTTHNFIGRSKGRF